MINPDLTNKDKEFMKLIKFLGYVCPYYTKELINFPSTLFDLLEKILLRINPYTRQAIVQTILLLRNRKQLDLILILDRLLPLMNCNDKIVRSLIFKNLSSGIRKFLSDRNVSNIDKNNIKKLLIRYIENIHFN